MVSVHAMMTDVTRKLVQVQPIKWTVCANVGSANNMNKLSLVGMQLADKYKENFYFSRAGCIKLLITFLITIL